MDSPSAFFSFSISSLAAFNLGRGTKGERLFSLLVSQNTNPQHRVNTVKSLLNSCSTSALYHLTSSCNERMKEGDGDGGGERRRRTKERGDGVREGERKTVDGEV